MNDKDHGMDAALDSELWKDVEKTLAETAPPPGFDARDLVSRSLRAYWDDREAGAPAHIERETAALYRRVAERFRDPWAEFWLESFLAAVPAAMVLLTFAVKDSLPGWWPPAAVIASLLLMVPLVRIARRGSLSPRWEWLRNSAGALAGSLLIAAALGLWLQGQNKESAKIATRLLEKELEQLALTSLDKRLSDGSFLQPNEARGLLSVTTQEVSADQAVYKASLPNRSGEMVASLSTTSGELSWDWQGTKEVKTRIAVGTFVQVEEKTVRIAESDQKFLDLRLDPTRVGPLPPAGEKVLVAYDPKDSTLQRLIVRTHAAALVSDHDSIPGGVTATSPPHSEP